MLPGSAARQMDNCRAAAPATLHCRQWRAAVSRCCWYQPKLLYPAATYTNACNSCSHPHTYKSRTLTQTGPSRPMPDIKTVGMLLRQRVSANVHGLLPVYTHSMQHLTLDHTLGSQQHRSISHPHVQSTMYTTQHQPQSEQTAY